MPLKKGKIEKMLLEVEEILAHLKTIEARYTNLLAEVHPNFELSAKNLVQYRAMRSRDIRKLQKYLGLLGLSRLAKAEGHTLTSLHITKSILQSLLGDKPLELQSADLSIKESTRLVRGNVRSLLGTRTKGRRTRIMVTLPSEAARDYEMVKKMVKSGMNCARINCAHDGPEQWKAMAGHVRKASAELEVSCRIAMDLAGPKIRTGEIVPGPKVRKYRPTKDNRGVITEPLEVWLGKELPVNVALAHVPVAKNDLKYLKKGKKLFFRDARGKKRRIVITKVEENGAYGEIDRTTFLETGMQLYLKKNLKSKSITVASLPAIEEPILLCAGDHLRLHSTPEPGEPTLYDKDGQLLQEAHISCTSEEVFNQVEVDDPVLFDDGMIKGKIVEVREGEFRVKILHTKEGGGKLRADKGINLPDSNLTISGLTDKDKEDLQFVAQHADVANVSFVNSAEDVKMLLVELKKINAIDKLGIILKIETKSGFDNLLEILLTAMQVYPLGVMIARGDLAIEVGWENIGRVQEEILSLCQAAHIPDIWATQVLENMAKRGIPSRAEITDAAMAQRAECVMLNKGEYIMNAIKLLDTILKNLEPYQDKKAPMLPVMQLAGGKGGKRPPRND